MRLARKRAGNKAKVIPQSPSTASPVPKIANNKSSLTIAQTSPVPHCTPCDGSGDHLRAAIDNCKESAINQVPPVNGSSLPSLSNCCGDLSSNDSETGELEPPVLQKNADLTRLDGCLENLCNASNNVKPPPQPCIGEVRQDDAETKVELTQEQHLKIEVTEFEATDLSDSTVLLTPDSTPTKKREEKSTPTLSPFESLVKTKQVQPPVKNGNGRGRGQKKSDTKATQIRGNRGKSKETNSTPSKLITDFFPVRRSTRMSKSVQEECKQKQLEEYILSGREDGLEVVDIVGKGRGVVATKPFKRGEFVVEYHGDLISVDVAKLREEQYAATPDTYGCYMYYFTFNSKQYCVDATAESGRLGRLINHSRKGNVKSRQVAVGAQPHLILVASRDVEAGEELLYDYGDRSKTSLNAHPWLAL
ncbi:PREDICTED: N-lysine methyltransferase SETD8-B-like isoform X2 [Priapulus caudatus]|uniref:[histone H4]-lysine(20) N-methyltransferase n=1 Tax=Priapulus caudatus TaxID=37621 RepID=A0ABM1ELX9_PRICU|nr:PREDICTED: N-lysine methyltransferase SETD8-B-like isoform X2 [Priapulus caudatus]